MKELTGILNTAARLYYSEDIESPMSDHEYDALYNELEELEKETGVIMAGSPTQRVGYEVQSSLPKEEHEKPMLSLDKTKEVEVLADFAGEHKSVLSWKLDGLTVVLSYNEGKLVKAVTRGNGYVGEVITPNAKTFINLPLSIPYKGELVIRGEALISYKDFERINAEIDNPAEKYKNPRNLCSGSVRQLNSEITAARSVRVIIFNLIKADGVDFSNSREGQFEWLEKQGFEVVERKLVTGKTIPEAVSEFKNKIESNEFPSDGLVLLFDDIAYGEALGTTAKFPRNAIAFKWQDEIARTRLTSVEWSASRTGLINPIAVFEPVELEGTTVSRASVHNVSIVKELSLGIGDEIDVYKANMIIPQIAENHTRSGSVVIPKICPSCGGTTEIKQFNEAMTLFCGNKNCPAKNIKGFEHFVERNALNIEGISTQTIEKFLDYGFLKSFSDFYQLDRFKDRIVELEGFGEKSFDNMIASIEKSRTTTLANVIYGVGINGIGLANAKIICRHFDYDFEKILNASYFELITIDKVGEVLARALTDYFSQEENVTEFRKLISELTLIKEERAGEGESPIYNKIFVITGSLNSFANRDELKNLIESLGGKTTGSVTSKTDYLINNDITSNSAKNKKAKELSVPIISEEDFRRLVGLIE